MFLNYVGEEFEDKRYPYVRGKFLPPPPLSLERQSYFNDLVDIGRICLTMHCVSLEGEGVGWYKEKFSLGLDFPNVGEQILTSI